VSTNHYFSEQPAGQFKTRQITIELFDTTYQVLTAGSVFSPDHVDQGTALLIKHMQNIEPNSNLLDIGCGWGPICLALALSSPTSTVYAIDVNPRSLELTKLNAAKLGLTNIVVSTPDELPKDVEFTSIWSNPPIRVGKAVLHEILQTWLPRLKQNAEAKLVVQKHLGSDSLQRWLEEEFSGYSTTRVESSKGFRIISVTKN
jgi:16S rRNA G1207 methylase RsmC